MGCGLCFSPLQPLALPCTMGMDGWCQVSCVGLHLQTMGHGCSSALNLSQHFEKPVSMDLGWFLVNPYDLVNGELITCQQGCHHHPV